MNQTERFRHESLQDTATIKTLLKALTQGIGAGKVTLEDENGKLVMTPSGMLRLKINGSIEDGQNKLDIRITWQGDDAPASKKPPKIK